MKITEEKVLAQWIVNYINKAVAKHQPQIGAFVAKLRLQNPDITDEALLKKVVGKKSLKSGAVVASIALCGVITLPLLAPACLLVTLKTQIYRAIATAYIYGCASESSNLESSVCRVLAENSSETGIKNIEDVINNALIQTV
jgi:hypothetical protein